MTPRATENIFARSTPGRGVNKVGEKTGIK